MIRLADIKIAILQTKKPDSSKLNNMFIWKEDVFCGLQGSNTSYTHTKYLLNK